MDTVSRSLSHPRVLAILGPTNTGKTHFAIERMLGHHSGMIGLPLRLLAREVYDRVVSLKGERIVALITGEEKIVPRQARYFVCTVEAMSSDRPVDCLVVDEIQLASHPERGHVFTDRLLHARGMEETIFCGAETMKPVITALVPGVEILTRPRLSQLTYSGYKKPARLPPRSAIVAFSATEVYRIAEFIRQHRGGTAVVLGALSPRTRNAQVELFEKGEVDYLVATDAIGMGLNLDIAHVAFARDSKFDGRNGRRLWPEEVAQIAGRAGRHMRDGTFGTTFELKGFAGELVEAIEEHRFDPIAKLYWRNTHLDFSSPRALLSSLDRRPDLRLFAQRHDADDHRALKALTQRLEGEKRTLGRERTRLLWEICQIPDFRKIMSDDHVRLLGEIFDHMSAKPGRLPADWVRREIEGLDNPVGTIEMLTAGLAAIRTWTYVTAKTGWVQGAEELHAAARVAENRISDALHAALSERFVDRRSASLARATGTKELLAGVRPNGEVVVEGHVMGELKGFCFAIDETVASADRELVLKTANRALQAEIRERVAGFAALPDSVFSLELDGGVAWQGARIARLGPGPRLLEPEVVLEKSELLEPAQQGQVEHRLSAWLRTELRRRLQTLFGLTKAREDASLDPELRGIAFVLLEATGSVPNTYPDLTASQVKWLQSRGVTIGTRYLYMKGLLKTEVTGLLALLWNVQRGTKLAPPKPNRVSLPVLEETASFYGALGYPVMGTRAVRIDRLDELAAALASGMEIKPKQLTRRLTCTPREAQLVIDALVRRPAKARPDHRFRQLPFAGLQEAME